MKRKYTCSRCGKQGHGSNHCRTILRKAEKRKTIGIAALGAGLGLGALFGSIISHPCCRDCPYKKKYKVIEGIIDDPKH